MKEKNVFVEILELENGERYFVVREPQMQQPPKCLYLTDSASDLAAFLINIKM